MATATIDKKKLITEGQKLLKEGVDATVGLVKAATEHVVLGKHVKASRLAVIKIIKRKPYDAQKVKAATVKHNALVKKADQKIAALYKAAVSQLETAAKKIDAFLKKHQKALSKAGQTQLNTLAKNLKSRLTRIRQDIKFAK